MKQTKILCTIGPASEKVGVLVKMMQAGMNAARLNFSHGTYKNHKVLLRNIRSAAKKTGKVITIVQDLQGPRIRVGKLPEGGVRLQKGKDYIFTTDIKYKDTYNNDKIFVTYNKLHLEIKKGETILISDGLIKLEVIKIKGKDIKARVKIAGVVKSNKGLNFPQTKLKISPITKKDREDLEFGLKNDIDWVAISFVGSADNIHELRRIINRTQKKLGLKPQHEVKIVPKIEKSEAIHNIDEIIEAADGIMIARGDLGIELAAQKVPILQKQIIKKCLEVAKPAIVATQMLESMMENPRPTRAEVSDVANAVIDHTDVVMLSGESAGGKYPIEAVDIMSKTIQEIEGSPYDDLVFNSNMEHDVTLPHEAVGLISGVMSHTEQIDAIFVASLSGKTARYISRFRPELPLYMGAVDKRVMRQMNLVWGVQPFYLGKALSSEQIYKKGIAFLKKNKKIKKGQRVFCIVGEPAGKSAGMNLVKIITV